MSEQDSNPEDDERMQAILAAFGDDALNMLDDEEDDEAMLLEAAAIENGEKASPTESESENVTAQTWVCEVPEDATPLVRYMTELSNAIYSRETQPADSKRTPRFIVFLIGEQQFGLPLENAIEIARYPRVTKLPCTPNWLRGVTNLRGQIISITGLRELLEESSERPKVGEKVIFTHSEQPGMTSGIVVDRVIGLRNYSGQTESIADASDCINSIALGQATIENKHTILIDPEKLFEVAQLPAFA